MSCAVTRKRHSLCTGYEASNNNNNNNNNINDDDDDDSNGGIQINVVADGDDDDDEDDYDVNGDDDNNENDYDDAVVIGRGSCFHPENPRILFEKKRDTDGLTDRSKG